MNALVADVPKFEADALNTKCGPSSCTTKTAGKKNVQTEPGRKRLEKVLSNVQVLCLITKTIMHNLKMGGKSCPRKLLKPSPPSHGYS